MSPRLREADDADGVVDRVVLRPAARAELERRDADRDRAEPGDDAVARRRDGEADGASGSASRSGSPPCARIQRSYVRERGAVGDGGLGAAPALGDVDAEIGEREQARARVEHELGEVGRPVAADGVERLADLERVADRAAERLVHVGQQARRPRGRPACRARASSRRATRASSSVFMNAPSPTLTSRTIASAPAASFFDMIDAAISGTLSTVAVTSRSA